MVFDFSRDDFKLVFETSEDNILMLKKLSYGDTPEITAKSPMHFAATELHITGENPLGQHGAGAKDLYGSRNLRYVSHTVCDTDNGRTVEFLLTDGKLEVAAHYQLYDNIAVVRAWTTVKNVSNEPVGLEYVSSFALTGFDSGVLPADEKLRVMIPHNSWMRELQWQEYTLPELGFSRTCGSSTKRIHIKNLGSWSTKEYLPMGAITNTETNNTVMWQIEHNGSWVWELGDTENKMYLCLSGPEEREHHWWRKLCPGESFESVKAAVSVGRDFNGALEEMTGYRRTVARRDGADASLPIIFNDYMNCLNGDPTEDKEFAMVDRAANAGAEVYVIDAGWYADGSWWDTVGEWKECPWRFPNGLKHVLDYIKSKNMIPGLWLEPEVMGINCLLAKKFDDECFFMRHGKRIIANGRYQLDYRNSKVHDYMMSVFDRLIAEYGVGYFKLDYNIEIGTGTEVDSDSCGDGLLEHNRAYLAFLDEVLEKYPQLILENCSSGGLRMEYMSLAHSHLQSTSDQMNYVNYSHISAAASTAVLPEQAAVWSYPKACDSLDGVVMNMVNSMLLRVHLSGEIAKLSGEQLALVNEGIDVMKSIRADVSKAVPVYPCGVPAYTDKLFAVAYKHTDCTRIAVWRLDTDEGALSIPAKGSYVKVLYPSSFDGTVEFVDGSLHITMPRINTAVIVEVR